MIEIGKGGRRLADHFVEVTDMVEVGKGGERVEDHFVGSDQVIAIGKGGQRMELFGVQVPGARRSTAPNHKRTAPREVRRNGNPRAPLAFVARPVCRCYGPTTMTAPRTNLSAAPRTAQATALLLAAALLALLLLLRLAAAADRGLDFTDEAFDLIVLSAPARYPALPTLFGFFLHPLYRALDGNIAALRLANFAATYLLGSLFFWSLLAWKFPADRLSPMQRLTAALALGASALALFGTWMVAPSYNSLALQGSFVIAAATLRLLAAPQRLELPALLGIGLGGWVVFMAKPTTAALLALALLALLVACHPRWLRAVVVAGSAASSLLLATAVALDGSPAAFAQRLLHAAQQAGAQDSRYSAAGLFRIELPRVDAGVVLFAIAVALLGLLLRPARAQEGGRPWLLRGAVAVLATYGLLALLRLDGWPVAATPDKGVVLLAPLLTSLLLRRRDAATGEQPDGDASRRRMERGVVIFLAILPWIYAFGTNNNPWHNMGFAASFWVALAVVLTRAPSGPQAPPVSLAAVTVVAVVASTGLLMSAMRHPYRQASPIGEQEEPVAVRGKALRLSGETATYLRDAAAGSRAAGLAAETPLIDLTGHSPGLVYALGARSPGDPWLIGGYPNSDQRAVVGLQLVACSELASAWLLAEPTGLRRLNEGLVLGAFGAALEGDYLQVAAWHAPAAPGWKQQAGEQRLYRPQRPAAEAEVACARVRAAGGLAPR